MNNRNSASIGATRMKYGGFAVACEVLHCCVDLLRNDP
jgi:hypothetical protein